MYHLSVKWQLKFILFCRGVSIPNSFPIEKGTSNTFSSKNKRSQNCPRKRHKVPIACKLIEPKIKDRGHLQW